MRVRVELGPRDAAAGQCVLATHAGPPGQPAAKRVVAAGPALAAAARAALGLPAQEGEEEDEGGGPDGAAPAPAAGQGTGGGAGGWRRVGCSRGLLLRGGRRCWEDGKEK